MVYTMNDIKHIAEMKTEILKFSTEYFTKMGFKWLLPKILSPLTDPLWPDPAEQQIEPVEIHIKTYNQKFKLMHSMILHKQIAIAKGIDKLFILSPNIRIEARKPDGWHAFEFTQLDFEVEQATDYHIMHILKEYIVNLTEYLHSKNLIDKYEHPFRFFKRDQFKVYDWKKIIDKYGSDKALLEKEKKPFFITNIPREFYDYEDPETGKWRNYDLYIPPWGEVSSGGEREWQYNKIMEKIKKDGLNPEAFKPYLEYAKKGLLKPSAGAGIGIERLTTIFTLSNDIKNVQIFPRIPFKPTQI